MSDDQSDQKHTIERLLGKPLLPLTQQRPYKIREESWLDLDALERLAQKRKKQPAASKSKSPFGKAELDYLTRIEGAMQNPI